MPALKEMLNPEMLKLLNNFGESVELLSSFPSFSFDIKSMILLTVSESKMKYAYCEAQARVRQGSARDGSQGERP